MRGRKSSAWDGAGDGMWISCGSGSASGSTPALSERRAPMYGVSAANAVRSKSSSVARETGACSKATSVR